MPLERPIVFPDILLVESSNAWNLAASTFFPGQTGSGAFPVGRLDGGGVWVMSATLFVPVERDKFLTYRAMRMLNQGGARPMILYRNEANVGFPPWPTSGGVNITSIDAIPHSDDTTHSDLTGYYQRVIVADTVGAAALRDTSLVIHFTRGGPLRGGECFSIDCPNQGWRMHEITTVSINDSGDSVITIEPPLREAISDGTELDFDLPRCVMRCRTPQALDLEISPQPRVMPAISFVEHVYPYPA